MTAEPAPILLRHITQSQVCVGKEELMLGQVEIIFSLTMVAYVVLWSSAFGLTLLRRHDEN